MNTFIQWSITWPRKEKIMSCAVTWMDLEIVILSKVSQAEKDTFYMIWLIHGILRKWYKWTYLQNRNRVIDVENNLMVTMEERKGRDKLGDWYWHIHIQIRSGQSLSRVRLFATPWIAAHQASLSITNSWSSPRLMSIESVMPSSHLILCRPLLLLPPIPPSTLLYIK